MKYVVKSPKIMYVYNETIWHPYIAFKNIFFIFNLEMHENDSA
jgi:hypothetical protein